MRVAVAGGKNKADYLIRSLLENRHTVVAIHDDPEYCRYLARCHKIPVVCGDPCKRYVLDDAEIDDFDILIALRPQDADNLVICQNARLLYHIRKTVSIVSDPKHVEIFQRLGVSRAISATHLVASYIEQASTIENLIDTLSLEQGRISLTEVMIARNSYFAGRTICDISLPEGMVISSILRGVDICSPHDDTTIEPNDKLLILSQGAARDQVLPFFIKGTT